MANITTPIACLAAGSMLLWGSAQTTQAIDARALESGKANKVAIYQQPINGAGLMRLAGMGLFVVGAIAVQPVLAGSEESQPAQVRRRPRVVAQSESPEWDEDVNVGDGDDTDSELFVDGKVNPAILAMPTTDRANILLDNLAESGCDVRSLLRRPTLASGGLQRSGKTTLILLTAIFEKAFGQKVFYISRDNDLYPIAFDGYAIGSKEKAMEALQGLSQKIANGKMGSLKGETWVLDEFSTLSNELDKDTSAEFWGMALTGFAKQGGRVRFMVHHKTAKANGIPPGQAETFKAEVKMLWSDRKESPDGDYFPSGRYDLLEEKGGYYQATSSRFEIPDWLKFDRNKAWHNSPCPVRSLLAFFPEFDTRKGAAVTPLKATKHRTNIVPIRPVDGDDVWSDTV
jgi:hypothetical protein